MENELIEGVISNTDENDWYEIEIMDISYEQGIKVCELLGLNPNHVNSIRLEPGGISGMDSPIAVIKRIKRKYRALVE